MTSVSNAILVVRSFSLVGIVNLFVQWQAVSLQKCEASGALERETVNDHRRTEFFKATRIIYKSIDMARLR